MLNNDTMPWYLPDRHPLLWHEARCQLRGKRGYFVMLAYGVALTAVLVASSYFISEMRDAGKQVQAGKALYQVFLVGQLLLVVFLAPSVTAGVMANELEHGLFEQLVLTPLRPFAMVWGKFLGAVTPLLLMTLSGLPVIATGTLCGGIAWQDVLVGCALAMASALYYAALGFAASCWSQRVVYAIVRAYGFTLATLVCTPCACGLLGLTLFGGIVTLLLGTLLIPNPFFYLLISYIHPGIFSQLVLLWATAGMLLQAFLILLICSRRVHWLRANLPRGFAQI